MLFHCNSKIVRCADRRRLTTCTNSASTPLPHPTSVDGYLRCSPPAGLKVAVLGVVPGVSDIAKRQSAMGGTNAAAQQHRAGSITVSLGGFGPNLNVSGHIGLIIKIGSRVKSLLSLGGLNGAAC